MKYLEIIDCSNYREGSGYEQTETISNEIVSSSDVQRGLSRGYKDFFEEWIEDSDHDEYFVFRIELFAEDADPMFDGPIRKFSYQAYWNDNDDLIIEEYDN